MSVLSTATVQRFAVTGISLALLLTIISPAFARRDEITIKAPGVVIKQGHGWFGTKNTQYNDALGNHYGYSRGVLGGETVSGGVLGTHISQSRSGLLGRKSTNVVGPNNEVLVQQKTSLLGKKSTVVDLDSMLHNARQIFGNSNLSHPTGY